MPTRITQIERAKTEASPPKGIEKNRDQPDCSRSESGTPDPGTEPTVFKVEGTLYRRDAELLEKICRDVCSQTKRPVTLELAELSYLDNDSAAVLCRLKREQNVSLEGLHLFIEKVVELTEESEKAAKYMPKPNRPVK